jgi:hypothetical protein
MLNKRIYVLMVLAVVVTILIAACAPAPATPTPGWRATAIVATLTALPPLPSAVATRLARSPEPTRGE